MDEAPTLPDGQSAGRVRFCDAERDEVLGRLREGFANGRLSHDTFLLRMGAVLQARYLSDLSRLLRDRNRVQRKRSAVPPRQCGRLSRRASAVGLRAS